MVPRHSACCFGSLKTRTQINEEAAGNNYFLISSQAALLVRSLSLKGKGNRESMPLLTSTRCFLKEYKVSKVHLALLKYKIDEWFYRGLKGLFVSCYTWFNKGPSIIFSCDGKKKDCFCFDPEYTGFVLRLVLILSALICIMATALWRSYY